MPDSPKSPKDSPKDTPKDTPKESNTNVGAFNPPDIEKDEFGDIPDFIYGGPFIRLKKPSTFLECNTPTNLPLSGTFKTSHAHECLKNKLPVILTKIIDAASRGGINSKYIENVAKLKNDLVTDKQYAPFTEDSEEANKWNKWIREQTVPNYFGNTWCFTECYVYRKVVEAGKLCNVDFDPFEQQKAAGWKDNVEPMCVIADRMTEYLELKEDKNKRKEEWGTLLKLSLWANTCDMSMTAEPVTLNTGPPPPLKNPPPPAKAKKGKATGPPPYNDPGFVDPFDMIALYKINTLADDSNKSFDALCARRDKIKALMAKFKDAPFKQKCSCHRLAKIQGIPLAEAPPDFVPPSNAAPPPPSDLAEGEKPPEAPKIPCPTKLCVPSSIFFDIVCDNAGYELFTDLCVAHYVIAQELAEKVRFHLKKYPWFVSDATPKDFTFVINSCKGANFKKSVEIPAKSEEEEAKTKNISSQPLQELGRQWSQFVDDGTFIVMTDDYWTYPHGYKDMKKYDPLMYRKLQYAAMILFKGDLNYRKLLGDRNCVTISTLEPNLQGFIPAPILTVRAIKTEVACGLPKGKAGFHPAPILAVRGVKSELICGLPVPEEGQPTKANLLHEQDPGWMAAGKYGTIQLCKKAEPFKPSDRPCIDYGVTCFGTGCPVHKDF